MIATMVSWFAALTFIAWLWAHIAARLLPEGHPLRYAFSRIRNEVHPVAPALPVIVFLCDVWESGEPASPWQIALVGFNLLTWWLCRNGPDDDDRWKRRRRRAVEVVRRSGSRLVVAEAGR